MGQYDLERRKRPTRLPAVEQDTRECAQEPKRLRLGDDPRCNVGVLVHLSGPFRPQHTVVDLGLERQRRSGLVVTFFVTAAFLWDASVFMADPHALAKGELRARRSHLAPAAVRRRGSRCSGAVDREVCAADREGGTMARYHEVWGQREMSAVEAVQPQVGVADSVAAVEHGLTVARERRPMLSFGVPNKTALRGASVMGPCLIWSGQERSQRDFVDIPSPVGVSARKQAYSQAAGTGCPRPAGISSPPSTRSPAAGSCGR